LKENLRLRYKEIALLMNRNERTIWSTYNNAKKKLQEEFILGEVEYYLPIKIFENRKFSVLEIISKYLHENLNLSYHKIAILINRDDRTIWTVYHRYQLKRRKT
jgi:hypothetical protein